MSLAIPDDLTERDQWVLWKLVDRSNGGAVDVTKVPFQPDGRHASSTDPLTWDTFDVVVAERDKHPERYSGIGFVFSPADPFSGIDVDDCLDAEGQVKPWAQGIIHQFG